MAYQFRRLQNPVACPLKSPISAPEDRNPRLGTAEQRIALFRSLFRGRDDVYAIRWESGDGRSGYMPKGDRDWKSYLRARDEDRKKVDRLTRTYRSEEHRVGKECRSRWSPD